ncbi:MULTISPECIES: FxsB family cyclophane-forming radical SAM/SPASM peptide maturase [unclassified Streptomyces]|uniref:FxsB family cyclophane-forming radical SAM/SPASM peptide maturase n=1 Tax=unclassified Streptomyces TaxID=2593676 RepID=UPI00382D539C
MVGAAGTPPTEDEAARHAPWPLRLLDVPALRRAGTPAVPFRQFVLKVHSRCNLACTYCYIYQGADTSWRARPTSAASGTMRRTVARIAEHVATHGLRRVQVDLHGGEPLLRGPEPLLAIADLLRSALPSSCAVDLAVQTNGTLLTEQVLARLTGAGIHVGLSLDGGTPALNRRRVDHAGRSSWAAVARAARLLREHPEAYSGLLATIDLAGEPEETYTSLVSLGPPFLDLLLPHANWSRPPPGGDGGSVPYGRWLCRVFDLWWQAAVPGPPVRLFREIVGLLLGRPGTSESVGLSPVVAVVVDTDGSIGQVDSLMAAYHGAMHTGLSVFTDPFDAALDHPGMAARQLGADGLSAACRRCSLVKVCGGGNYAHRFSEGSGFLHPSVYCSDLEFLIRHIADRLAAALPADRTGHSGLNTTACKSV